MRTTTFVVAFILSIPGLGAGQELAEYHSIRDGFKILFFGEPAVTDITWTSHQGYMLPGHVYRADRGREHYSVTVVDYANVQKIHADRLKNCQAYPNLCNNPYVAELRGAMDFATWSFIKRDAKVTYFAYGNSDRIEGRRIQLTNADRSRTFVAIHMHQNRLYVFEATVPAGAPPPALFQQSLGFLDKDGIRVRYDTVYSNMYPPPSRVQYGPPPFRFREAV